MRLHIPLSLVLCVPVVARADSVDFNRDVRPILAEHCFSCHGPDEAARKADLRLDTRDGLLGETSDGRAVAPGKPGESDVIARISATDAARVMPPPKTGKKLTAAQVETIRKWVEQGAKWSAHWAFVPVSRPTIPPPLPGYTTSNPIDNFVAARLARDRLSQAAPADRATLLRRVYLDLIGLPPTPAELRTFLDDPAPDAYERVVDTLLSSPRYGERWGRHWMDVWRYSDWYGRRSVPDVLNSYGQIWRWRDWIARGINSDRGYDDMVRMMLAADELAPADDEELVATGFVVRNFFRWNYNNWMRDNVEHTAKAFLGLTLNCCHCHDHKYDPLSQDEYFHFRAVFEPVEIRHDRVAGEPDPGPYPKYKYGAAYKPITTGMVRVTDERLDAPTHFYTGGDERNVVKGRPPVPPGVPATLGGRYHVAPVTLPPQSWYPGLRSFVRAEETATREQAVNAARAEFDRAKEAAAVRLAGAKLAAATADLVSLRARIAADDVVHLGAKGDAATATAAAARAERLHAVAVAELALVQAESSAKSAKDAKAGEKQRTEATAKLASARKALDEPATTYSPISPVYAKSSSGRRSALARWITARDNPLTARVAVNHIWGRHFGRPLVETANNFGTSGKPPSHPDLLDWLAAEFMAHGWSTKHLHRLIVTSVTYRQSSRISPPTVGHTNPQSADADNLLLWRFPAQRMDAEVVRDSMLHVAGDLDLTTGGPDVPQDQGLTSRRRSVWFTHHGEARMQFLDLFDAANPCDAYRRTSSVLPQQALALANSDLALRLSRTLAARIAGDSDEEFVRAAFVRVLNRDPTAAETRASTAFLRRQRDLFTGLGADTKPTPGGPSCDPGRRAREGFVLALFSHTDFVTVR